MNQKEFAKTASNLVNDDALAKAAQLKVYDADGADVEFGKLIGVDSDETVVVVFIRHFACSMCQVYLQELSKDWKSTDNGGTLPKLVVIGCGQSSAIKPYKDLLKVDFDTYADPKRDVFTALGMTLRCLDRGEDDKVAGYGSKMTFFNSMFQGIASGAKMGIFSMSKSGDIKQLGGDFIFKSGKNTYAHRMINTRDHTDISKLVQLASE